MSSSQEHVSGNPASCSLPVMTSRSSCLVQTFTRIITPAPLFAFLSVVGRHAARGRRELHRCLPSPCLDYTKAVCGPDPRWDWSRNYCQQCEQRRHRLSLYREVLHHYLADWLTRIPPSWAVKSLQRSADWSTLLSSASWEQADVTWAAVTLVLNACRTGADCWRHPHLEHP